MVFWMKAQVLVTNVISWHLSLPFWILKVWSCLWWFLFSCMWANQLKGLSRNGFINPEDQEWALLVLPPPGAGEQGEPHCLIPRTEPERDLCWQKEWDLSSLASHLCAWRSLWVGLPCAALLSNPGPHFLSWIHQWSLAVCVFMYHSHLEVVWSHVLCRIQDCQRRWET